MGEWVLPVYLVYLYGEEVAFIDTSGLSHGALSDRCYLRYGVGDATQNLLSLYQLAESPEMYLEAK